jgi:hypothetical protein
MMITSFALDPLLSKNHFSEFDAVRDDLLQTKNLVLKNLQKHNDDAS